MNTMEDAMMTIKHLTMLLEEARQENHDLREELNQIRGLLWLKNNKPEVCEAEPEWMVRLDQLAKYSSTGNPQWDNRWEITCSTGMIDSIK